MYPVLSTASGRKPFGTVDDGVAPLEQLHAAGVPLYGLTNWSAETYHHVEDKYDFMTRFRHVAVSGCIGMAKPEPRIYAHLLEHETKGEDCASSMIMRERRGGDLIWPARHHPSQRRGTSVCLRDLGVAF